MWTDDISFCPYEKCKRKTCPRNQMNIRDRTIPHSYFVERPPDCPYRKKQDDFYHVRKKDPKRMPDREKVIKGLAQCDMIGCTGCPYHTKNNDGCKLNQEAIDLLRLQQLDIEALKNTIQGMVEGQCIIAGDKRVDVVRCKDCKHWFKDECSYLCALTGDLRKADWFCADGERKEGL